MRRAEVEDSAIVGDDDSVKVRGRAGLVGFVVRVWGNSGAFGGFCCCCSWGISAAGAGFMSG
jgi:hypothetical protein